MKKYFYTYLLLIILTMTTTSTFSQKKKVPTPDGNDYYNMYEKKGNIIHIYDNNDYLVREVHLNKDIAYDFFNKEILLHYLGETGFISSQIFFSKKKTAYLATSMQKDNFIEPELGFQEKYEINKETGLSRLIYSNEYFENQPPPPSPSELTKEEKEYLKYYEENKDSIAYLNRLDKTFDEENKIYIYTKYEKGKKVSRLYFLFNDQDLISDSLVINTSGSSTSAGRKSITYYRAKYDSEDNLISLKEYRTKNYKQFEELISKKGEGFFLSMLFKDMTKQFEFLHFETITYTYKKDRLSCSETIKHYSSDRSVEQRYKYDERDRLIEINVKHNNKPIEMVTYGYD